MKEEILGLLAVALLAGPMGANALTLAVGESAVLNFDMTSASPSPPYNRSVTFHWLDGPYGAVFARTEFFAEHDAEGEKLFDGITGGVITFENVFGFGAFSAIRDGIFSVRVSADPGAITVDPYVWGTVAMGAFPDTTFLFTERVYPLMPVPEPGTLALLSLGLLGLGVSRRKRELARREEKVSQELT